VALVAGVFAALVGKFVPRVSFLYDYAWFVGFFLAGAIYYWMMIGHRTELAEVKGLNDESW
jgi:NCS1 family nucleobase:cation symporter-1